MLVYLHDFYLHFFSRICWNYSSPEAFFIKDNPIWAYILRYGRWCVKFLGSCHIHTWVVWAKLCLLILYCRVFQYHLYCSRHPFSTHWSCEFIETAFWEEVLCTSYIKYDTFYWQYAISRHITATVSSYLSLLSFDQVPFCNVHNISVSCSVHTILFGWCKQRHEIWRQGQMRKVL